MKAGREPHLSGPRKRGKYDSSLETASKNEYMGRRAGYLLVLVGPAVLSPAADLLPGEVLHFFQPSSANEHHQYLRVVPRAAPKLALLTMCGIGAVAIGVLAIAVGWFIKSREARCRTV